MKLDKPVTIQPPPTSSNSGVITTPDSFEVDELLLTFTDDPQSKVISTRISRFPTAVPLYSGAAYDELGEWTKPQLEERLKTMLGDDPHKLLRGLFPVTMEEHPNHPGTQLSKMIKALGIHMSDSCSCRRHALKMNEMGNDWCEENLDTVLGWIRTEAKNRGLPFVDMVGKVMIKRAIKKSRKLLANEPVPENDEDLDDE